MQSETVMMLYAQVFGLALIHDSQILVASYESHRR